MASYANLYLGFDLPEDEIGFIAMYLSTLANKMLIHKIRLGLWL